LGEGTGGHWVGRREGAGWSQLGGWLKGWTSGPPRGAAAADLQYGENDGVVSSPSFKSALSIRLPADLERKLSHQVALSGQHRSPLIREALEAHLSRRERERAEAILVAAAKDLTDDPTAREEALAAPAEFLPAENVALARAEADGGEGEVASCAVPELSPGGDNSAGRGLGGTPHSLPRGSIGKGSSSRGEPGGSAHGGTTRHSACRALTSQRRQGAKLYGCPSVPGSVSEMGP
jgi:predicted transcriptional regulator